MKKKNLPKRVSENADGLGAKELSLKEIFNSNGLGDTVQNGLGDVLFGGNSYGIPNGQSTQLTQTDTLYKNLRWYLISNNRPLLSQAYVEIGLIQTICDVPVDDALRGGYDIKTKQLSEQEIDKLKARIQEIDLDGEIGQGAKWTRLYGGGGIIAVTGQDQQKPLKIEDLKKEKRIGFRSVDMWELFNSMAGATDYDSIKQLVMPEYFDFYGIQVHESRVFTMKGKQAPSFVRPRLRGWGFSACEVLISSINQYLKTNNLTFEVLDEFKLDIYKMKGLVQSLISKDGEGKIRQRVAIANKQKNYQNAIVLDSEDDYDHKQLSFTGIAETMKEIRAQVASDMRMPQSKLFGTPASGLNASTEDDIEVYNAMVESEVRAKIKRPHIQCIQVLCAHMFGYVPDDLDITYRPLRMLSAEQEENVKNAKFTRLMTASEKGAATPEEVCEGINRDNLLPIQVKPGVGLTEDLGEGAEDEQDESTEE